MSDTPSGTLDSFRGTPRPDGTPDSALVSEMLSALNQLDLESEFREFMEITRRRAEEQGTLYFEGDTPC